MTASLPPCPHRFGAELQRRVPACGRVLGPASTLRPNWPAVRTGGAGFARSAPLGGFLCPSVEAFCFERMTDRRRRCLERSGRFVGAVGAFEEVAAGREQSAVAVVDKSIELVETCCHPDGDGEGDSSRW